MDFIEKLFSLQGRIAIVTGAAGDIGKAIAGALLQAEATVVLVDVQDELLTKTAEQFRSDGWKAESFVCDVTDKVSLTNMVEHVEERHKRVDILVNCAGVTFTHEMFTYPAENWDKTYQVNLKAPFELSRLVAGVMKKQGAGSIINITSLGAERAFPNNPAYDTSKGALKQLTKSFALDLGKYGIRANNVGPGIIKANMTIKSWNDPKIRQERADKTVLGEWGQTKDIAHAVLFLASDASSYITGQDIYVDGGWLCKGL